MARARSLHHLPPRGPKEGVTYRQVQALGIIYRCGKASPAQPRRLPHRAESFGRASAKAPSPPSPASGCSPWRRRTACARLGVVEQLVLDAREAGVHAALEHDDALRLVDVEDRHAVDRARACRCAPPGSPRRWRRSPARRRPRSNSPLISSMSNSWS